MVASLDGIALLRRDAMELIGSEERAQTLLQELGAGANLVDLPAHGIFDRGALVGLWEYDPETESVMWASFVPRSRDLAAAVAEMGSYIRMQLGDARSFSLDSPKSRRPRIEALRRSQ